MNIKTTNMRTIGYLLVLILFLSNSSCVSYRNLHYLQDTKNEERMRGFPKTAPLYHIRTKDNLYVSLITNDVEVNKLYNPAHAGSTQSINNEFQTPANQLVYGFEVDSSGNVNLPLIGKVNVLGKTLNQSEKIIEDTARHFLKEVTAKVKLLNNRVTVMGEVKNPGMYYKYGPDFTVFEAIAMANGTTNYAQLDSVLVLRPIKDGSQTFVLNLKSKSGLTSDAYFLQPNDVVMIQPGKNKNLDLRVPIYTITIAALSAALLLTNIIVNHN
jgi:polysaccharide export outer membrane protein